MLRLEVPAAALVIDPDHGGRIRSFVVEGRELIVWERFRTIDWGSYPMAPFAGRLRDGQLAFSGRTYELPATEGPHAIHGTTLDAAWTVVDAQTIAVDLADPWPFRGRVTQRFQLDRGRLDATMTLETDEPQPAVLGWHPWFVRRPRRVGDTTGATATDLEPVELEFAPRAMYERGPDGIPTGRLIEPPPPPPWDDCFVDVTAGPTLRWPGFLELAITSDASHWVVYTGDADALAVEPQTGPPDGPNQEPRVIQPGAPLHLRMTWRWWSLAG
jgi:aldose 1-epimerase